MLGFWDAIRLSIRTFLPLELPLIPDWEPSERRWLLLRFSDWATLLKVVGWIIVPVGIASITGLLRRVAP